MRRLLPVLLTLAFLTGLVILFWPVIERAIDHARLLGEPAPTTGTLAPPLPGVRYVDTWGGARSEGRTHEGVDIFAPRGTPIRATTRGFVARIGENRLGGRTVTVIGPGGYHHYYAHLERYPDLRVGDRVQVGDVVGYVGDSGNARGTPPHLHYGVYTPTWRAVNPYPLLRRP